MHISVAMRNVITILEALALAAFIVAGIWFVENGSFWMG